MTVKLGILAIILGLIHILLLYVAAPLGALILIFALVQFTHLRDRPSSPTCLHPAASAKTARLRLPGARTPRRY